MSPKKSSQKGTAAASAVPSFTVTGNTLTPDVSGSNSNNNNNHEEERKKETCLHCSKKVTSQNRIQVMCDDCGSLICNDCHWCHEFQANHEIRVCDRCEAFYCKGCDEMDQCDDCLEVVCSTCSHLTSCKFCGCGLCEDCATCCGKCGIVLCQRDVKFAVECDTCKLPYCLVCLASATRDPCVRCGQKPSKRITSLVHLRLKSIYKAFQQQQQQQQQYSYDEDDDFEDDEEDDDDEDEEEEDRCTVPNRGGHGSSSSSSSHLWGGMNNNSSHKKRPMNGPVPPPHHNSMDVMADVGAVLQAAAAAAASHSLPPEFRSSGSHHDGGGGHHSSFNSAAAAVAKSSSKAFFSHTQEQADAAAAELLKELEEEEEKAASATTKASKKKKKKKKRGAAAGAGAAATKQSQQEAESSSRKQSNRPTITDETLEEDDEHDFDEFLKKDAGGAPSSASMTAAAAASTHDSSLRNADSKGQVDPETKDLEEQLAHLIGIQDVNGIETILGKLRGVPGRAALRKNAKKAVKRIRQEQEQLFAAAAAAKRAKEEEKAVAVAAAAPETKDVPAMPSGKNSTHQAKRHDTVTTSTTASATTKTSGSAPTRPTSQSSQQQPPQQTFLLKVVSLTNKNDPNQPPPPPPPPPKKSGSGLQYHAPAGAKAECVLHMAPSVVGWVIGKGGQRIRELMEETTSKVWIDQDSMGPTEPRIVYVSGSHKAVETAVRQMKDLVSKAPINHKPVNHNSMPAAPTAAAAPTAPPKAANPPAPAPAPAAARAPWAPPTAAPTSSSAPAVTATTTTTTTSAKDEKVEMTCEPRFVALLIGRRGWTVKHIQDASGARVDIDQTVTPRKITISGNPASVWSAVRMVRDVLSYPHAQLHHNVNGHVDDDDSDHHGPIVMPPSFSAAVEAGNNPQNIEQSLLDGEAILRAALAAEREIAEATRQLGDEEKPVSDTSSLSSTPDPSVASRPHQLPKEVSVLPASSGNAHVPASPISYNTGTKSAAASQIPLVAGGFPPASGMHQGYPPGNGGPSSAMDSNLPIESSFGIDQFGGRPPVIPEPSRNASDQRYPPSTFGPPPGVPVQGMMGGGNAPSAQQQYASYSYGASPGNDADGAPYRPQSHAVDQQQHMNVARASGNASSGLFPLMNNLNPMQQQHARQAGMQQPNSYAAHGSGNEMLYGGPSNGGGNGAPPGWDNPNYGMDGPRALSGTRLPSYGQQQQQQQQAQPTGGNNYNLDSLLPLGGGTNTDNTKQSSAQGWAWSQAQQRQIETQTQPDLQPRDPSGFGSSGTAHAAPLRDDSDIINDLFGPGPSNTRQKNEDGLFGEFSSLSISNRDERTDGDANWGSMPGWGLLDGEAAATMVAPTQTPSKSLPRGVGLGGVVLNQDMASPGSTGTDGMPLPHPNMQRGQYHHEQQWSQSH